MLKKTANLFITAYLLIMFCIYPFYIQDGYRDIGEAKNRFFLYVSIAAWGIMVILGRLLEKGAAKRAYLIDWDRFSATDLFVLLYAASVSLSYALTEYRQEALWGTEGWYIGCIPILLLCGLCFFISRLWDGNTKLLYALTAASAGVFFLGICNRFSFYPVPFEIAPPEFISTLGNINWYCGYLSVAAPVGIGMFVLGNQEKRLLGVYALITFMTSFSQGGDSIFLWFAALFFILLWISLERKEWIENWLLLVILWGVSAQLIRLMRYFLPGKYNYDVNNLCGYFTDSSFTLWIAAGAALVYTMMHIRNQRMLKEDLSGVRRGLLIAVFLLLGGWLVLSVANTKWGLPILEEHGNFQGLFLFDKNWGHGRGAAYSAGIKIFKEFTLLHKLFGAGPDCFSVCAYSIPELVSQLRESFGNSRLTNAHCELLTGLVNTGIFGVICFVGIFVSFIIRCIQKGKENPVIYIFAVCSFCYLIHNMLGFAQILNLPFVFLLIGMGEKLLKDA